jgi:glycopeptide antibiotics resistance protein
MNLIPIVETLKMLSGALLRDSLFNIIGNLILLIPFAFLLSWIYGIRKVRTIVVYSLGFSLIIEILQYASTTRIFDIDDIILNTLSGLLGYICFRIFSKAMPARKQKQSKLYKPSLKVAITGLVILLLSFLSVFAWTYNANTLSLSDVRNLNASQGMTELITTSKAGYQYILVKNGDALKVHLYGKLPLRRLVSISTSDPVNIDTSSAVIGDLNYQITYQKLDKSETSIVNQKAPYALFGYIPDKISGEEIYFEKAPFETKHNEQYFISVIEADVPFENHEQLMSVIIKDNQGKLWYPKFIERN